MKRHHKDAVLPCRATTGSAGYDVCAFGGHQVAPGERLAIPTEISIEVPPGHYGRLAPRSGLAKHGINVGAGVIDSDYRGKVFVLLFNHSRESFACKPGTRIAQLILERISTPEVEEVEALDTTERGEGGFGSTGTEPLPAQPSPSEGVAP